MGEKRDLGIAVTDAVRLFECLGWLAADFAARPFVIGDDLLDQHGFWTNDTSPGAIEWMHRCRTQGVAENRLARAVLDGLLPLWVRREDGEAKVDRFALKEFGPRDVRIGAYFPFNDWQSDLRARPLWVKIQDWLIFHAIIMRERYPEEFASPVEPETAEAANTVVIGAPTPNPPAVPLSDAHLKDWWKRLSPEGQARSQDDLLSMCRAAFPDRYISRQRIRDLTGPRKRGKPPNRQKPMANSRPK